MTIFAISGSPRPGSTMGQLLQATARLAPAGIRVVVYESLLELPLFSPHLDEPQATAPPAVINLRQSIFAADAVLLATPEYAYGMPGSLKNALDWMVSAGTLYGKPTGALSASAQGGEKALASLMLTLNALGALLVPKASFNVPLVRTKMDATGSIHDTVLRDKLHEALTLLTAATVKLAC